MLMITDKPRPFHHTHLYVRLAVAGMVSKEGQAFLPGHRNPMPHCSGKSTAVKDKHIKHKQTPSLREATWQWDVGSKLSDRLERQTGCLLVPVALTTSGWLRLRAP